MPNYTTVCENTTCPSCSVVKERLAKISERNSIECNDCKHIVKRLVDMPAKMKEGWSGGWTEGLSSTAKYDVGLGQVIYSERHRDKLLKEKGWVRESELGSSTWDRAQSKYKEDKIKEDRFATDYKANITKFGGDKERALVETLPAKKILNDEV